MKLYFRNPKTGHIRERVCENGQEAQVTKEESLVGYTELFRKVGDRECTSASKYLSKAEAESLFGEVRKYSEDTFGKDCVSELKLDDYDGVFAFSRSAGSPVNGYSVNRNVYVILSHDSLMGDDSCTVRVVTFKDDGKKESMVTVKDLASAKARIKKLVSFGDKSSVTASAEHKRSEYVVTVSAPSSHYLNAVHTVANALITLNCDFSRSRDGFYTIRFRTEDEAKKAFKKAYDTIKDEHSPLSAADSLGDDGLSLTFDGASATTEVVDATLYMLFGYPQESDFGVKDLSSHFTQDELERIKDKGMSSKDFRTVAEALRGKGAILVDYNEDEDGDKKISYEAIENMAHVGTRSELEKEGYLFGSIVVATADASTRCKTSRLLDMVDHGEVDPENTAIALLKYMSEDEVRDFAKKMDFIDESDKDELEDKSHRDSRVYTNYLLGQCEAIGDYKWLIEAAARWMSEDEVADCMEMNEIDCD